MKKDYTLDATGNRTQRVTTDQASGTVTDTQTLTYASDSNRLATLNESAVTHDAAGNQTQSDALRYTYDDQGRLSEVYQAGSQKVADYRYNSLGQRTVKRVLDPVSQALVNTTTYLYGLNGEALGQTLYNASGSKASGQYWFWLDGMPLAQVNTSFAADGTISASQVLYLHADHLNTPRLATDSAQTLLWSWNSDAYGVGGPNEDVDGDGHATQVALRFPGQVYDATSQLSYNYYRDYNAQTGRYVQSDLIGLEGGINTYGYVGGNPLSRIDPAGTQSIAIPAWLDAIRFPLALPRIGAAIGGAAIAGASCLLYPNNSLASPQMDDCAGGCVYSEQKGQRPSKTPNSGEPGSRFKNPGSGQERWYGEDGLPVKDIDWDHDHGQGVPHVHDWGRGDDGAPERGTGRPFNPSVDE